MKTRKIYAKPQMSVMQIDTLSMIAASEMENNGNSIKEYDKDDQNYSGTISF